MAQGDALRTYNYRMVHNQWDRNKPLDIKIDSLTAENRAALCKLFPIADEQLLMGENIMSYARSISNPLIDWPEEAKLKRHLCRRPATGFTLSTKSREYLTDRNRPENT